MAGNSFGKHFALTIFGESHGKCVGAVVDGCPAGLALSDVDIQRELNKRKPGEDKVGTSRTEADRVEMLSGVFNGFTTGAPICMIVQNRDVQSEPYNNVKETPRPGHADYTAHIRYGGFNDYRGGGIFSGRITIAYVMAGAVAKKLLKSIESEVLAHSVQIGRKKLSRAVSHVEIRQNVYKNSVRCADPETAMAMEKEILTAKRELDSVGGIVECLALNFPAGIGDPAFDSLDSDLAKMMFSIPGVKGVEFGAGFEVASLRGSENNDQFSIENGKVVTWTNRSGGILGGLSNAMPIIARVAFKPTSSILRKQQTVNLKKTENATIQLKGRYDPCIVPRAVPVVESSMAIVLVDHAIRSGMIRTVLTNLHKGK